MNLDSKPFEDQYARAAALQRGQIESFMSEEQKQKLAKQTRTVAEQEKLEQVIQWERERLEEKARREEEDRLAVEANLILGENESISEAVLTIYS